MATIRTALVPVTAQHRESPQNASQAPFNRSYAPFLAHLIATATGAPQTRERRRVAPHIAAGRYAAAPARPAVSIRSRSF